MTFKSRDFGSGFFYYLSNHKPAFALCFLILLFGKSLYSKDNSSAKDYLLSYQNTTSTAIEAPFIWEHKDWLKAGGFIFIGSGLYLFDEEISALVKRNRNDSTRDLALFANQFGNGKYVISALAITFLSGYALDHPKTRDTALLSLKSMALANGASLSLKFLTQRDRPFSNKGKQFWNGKGFNLKRESFPSGHATIVWSIAPILAEQYKETIWVAPTVYSIALLTSYARIHNQRHWSSDVYTGALIGYFTSQLVLKTTPRLEISPSLEPQGINLGYKF